MMFVPHNNLVKVPHSTYRLDDQCLLHTKNISVGNLYSKKQPSRDQPLKHYIPESVLSQELVYLQVSNDVSDSIRSKVNVPQKE